MSSGRRDEAQRLLASVLIARAYWSPCRVSSARTNSASRLRQPRSTTRALSNPAPAKSLFLSGFDDDLHQTFGPLEASAEGEAASDEPPSLRLFRPAARHRDLYRVLARRRGAWPVVRRRMKIVPTARPIASGASPDP